MKRFTYTWESNTKNTSIKTDQNPLLAVSESEIHLEL